tara:strand:+ start:138 stop:539 length:402 start_codon:yes stop_codon:yes gene_type:complete
MKKKKKKKKLKEWAEGFFKSDKNLSLDPKDFMSEGTIDFERQNLNILQDSIEDEISKYEVDFIEDLLDEGEQGVVRVLVISRGMQEVFVCFDAKGQMRGYSKKILRDLISRICNSMNHTFREGTSKSKNEPGT